MKHLLPLLLIQLGACTSLVPSTVAQLFAVSPLEADPGDIAVALRLPSGVDIQPGSAQIVLMANREDIGQTSAATYTLEATDTPDGTIIYQVAPTDYDRLRAQQRLIAGWEEENPEASEGSLSVTLGGCRTAEALRPDATLDISIRTEESGAFLPLVRDAKLTRAFKVAGISNLPPCA